MIRIDKRIENGKAVTVLEGYLDTVSAPELEKMLENSLDGIQELIFDFEKLEYVSSRGLRVLLSANNAMAG